MGDNNDFNEPYDPGRNFVNSIKTWYKPPPAVPMEPPPPPPKKEKIKTNIFIKNPKSLPTDLSKYERPSNHYQLLKKLKPLVPPPYKGLRFKNYARYPKPKGEDAHKDYAVLASEPRPEGIGRHVMRIVSGKKISEMKEPLMMERREVRTYAAKSQAELAAEAVQKVDSSNIGENNLKPHTVSNADIPKISPLAGAARNKQNMFKKKTIQIFEHDKEARETKLREEKPWVIADATTTEHIKSEYEDKDGAHYIALVINRKGFVVKDIDRHYRFSYRAPTSLLTLEEAEAQLKADKKKNKGNHIFQRLEQIIKKSDSANPDQDDKKKPSRSQKPNPLVENKSKRNDGDEYDELDFDDNFQDDEEGYESDQIDTETKETNERIRKKQSRFVPDAEPDSDSNDDDKDKSDIAKLLEREREREQREKEKLEESDALDSASSLDEEDMEKIEKGFEADIIVKPTASIESKEMAASKPRNKKTESKALDSPQPKKAQKNKAPPTDKISKKKKLNQSNKSPLVEQTVPKTNSLKPYSPSPLSQVTNFDVKPSQPEDLPYITYSSEVTDPLLISPKGFKLDLKAYKDIPGDQIPVPKIKDIAFVLDHFPKVTIAQLALAFGLSNNNIKKETQVAIVKLIREIVFKDPDSGKLYIQKKFLQ